MSASADYISWKMQYEISPIILTGGIATQQGGGVPIVSLTDPGLFNGGTDSISPELDGYFAHYRLMTGGKLLSQQIAMYPFANQAIAANAVITQPLPISMAMICPAGNAQTYQQKSAIIQALRATLAQHNNLGGTYSVLTPAFPYTDCIFMDMTDITGQDNQAQVVWKLDFLQPLVSIASATQAMNNLMTQLQNQTPTSSSPSWSGGLTTGNPTNVLSQSLVPPPLASVPGIAASQ